MPLSWPNTSLALPPTTGSPPPRRTPSSGLTRPTDTGRALSLWDGSEDDITDAALIPLTLEDVYMAVADSGDVARTDARGDKVASVDGAAPASARSDAHTPGGDHQ